MSPSSSSGSSPDSWIAIVGIVAGAVVAITVAILAAISGWRDRRHQSGLARDDRAHSLALAREERAQERIKGAYEDLLPTLHAIGAQVDLIERAIATDPPEKPPRLPSSEELSRQVAHAELFGSVGVRADIPRLLLAVRKLQTLTGSLEQQRSWAGWGAPSNLAETINQLRSEVTIGKQEIFDLIDRIETQMRHDLSVEPANP